MGLECYDEAIVWLEKFLRMRARDADALTLLGDCHFGKKQFSKALEFYKVGDVVEVTSRDLNLMLNRPGQGVRGQGQVWSNMST